MSQLQVSKNNKQERRYLFNKKGCAFYLFVLSILPVSIVDLLNESLWKHNSKSLFNRANLVKLSQEDNETVLVLKFPQSNL